MAQAFATAAQEIVYSLLNGNLTGCTVYDTVPFLPEAMPAANFPYCVIGEDTLLPWDNDDTVGADVTINLHFWSRASGNKQVKDLMAEAYAILNRANVTKTGYNVVDCLFEFGQSMSEPDGKTKHGVQRYRLTIQAAS
jgi:hypothetical protein